MKTQAYVIALFLGAASAEISQKQRDTVAELRQKITSGDLSNLMGNQAAQTLTTVHIDAADEQAIAADVESLGNDINQFVTDNNIESQVNTWSVNNNVEQRMNAFGDDLDTLANDLNTNNGIDAWAQRKNIDQRLQDIVDQIDRKVVVTEEPSIAMTTVHIDAADEQAIAADIKSVGDDIDQFVTENNIESQVNTWSVNNNVEQRMNAFGDDLDTLANDLNTNNGIDAWAQRKNIDQRLQDIVDQIDRKVVVTEEPSIAMTTVHIDPADEAAIKDDLESLGNDIDKFVTDNNIESQVNQWEVDNNIEKRVNSFGDDLDKLGNDLNTNNGIDAWAARKNVTGRIQDIVDQIDKNVEVTNVIQMPTNLYNSVNYKSDIEMIYTAFAVLVFASLYQAASSFRAKKTAKRGDFVEFEADMEASPAKESKKAVKKTLSKIMKKNNAEARSSLIQ